MTDPFIDARISSREANALYGAIKEDVGAAVARKSPSAKKDYNDAFEYSRKMHEIHDAVIQPLVDAKIHEKVFAAATAGTSEGASVLKTLVHGDKKAGVKGLNPSAMDAIRSVSLRKLGASDKGEFDAGTYLRNWSNMHNDAKDILFGKEGRELRNSLDALTKTSEKIAGSRTALAARREFGAEHAGQHVMAQTVGLGAMLMDSQALSFMTGRMLSNPTFIKWLARASKQPKASLKIAAANLAQQALNEDLSTQEDISKYLQSINGSVE
jgi:hypothetical protein